jgi:hypothetical protein
VAAVQPLLDQATAAEQRPSVLAVLATPPTGSSPAGPPSGRTGNRVCCRTPEAVAECRLG